MTKKVRDGIHDLTSSSPVNPVVFEAVSSFNRRIDQMRKAGIQIGIKKLTYSQMVFMTKYLESGDPAKAAFEANDNIKRKETARSWGMKQLENVMIQSTIRRALEGEQRLAPDKIAEKVADAFDNAATVGDVIKVAEFVTKTRGEYNDGNKLTTNIAFGIVGGESTEELERKFAILVGPGENEPIESRDDNLLDEITIRGRDEARTTEL